MKNYKEYLLVVGVIILGIICGILSKAGDVAGQGDFIGDTLYAFGCVSTGFFIWVVICTLISMLSKNQFWASVNVFIFLSAMILAYYLYSNFIVDYFSWSAVKFWIVMLIPASISGAIVWNMKTNKLLKYLVLVIGTLVFVYDILAVIFYYPIAAIMEVVLYGMFIALTLLSKRFIKA